MISRAALGRATIAAVVLAAAALAAPGRAAARPKAPPRWQTLPRPPAMPTPDATGDVAVGDASIHWASFGKGDAVVLLHGGLGNGEHWANQVAALDGRRRVIVIDARGQGRSSRGTKGVGYHLMAEDVIAVLDALKVDKAAVVGWSDGAILGLDLAIHHPDRLTRVFAFAANYDLHGTRGGGSKAATVSEYFARCKAEYKALSPHPEQLGAEVADLVKMWGHEPTFTKDQLRAIQVPMAIADGDHDEIIRRDHTDEMAKLIPGAVEIIVPEASHFALWQAPDDFDAAMIQFLDGK